MLRQKVYYVYILTNWNNAVLYIGFTNDILKRTLQHRNKKFDSFTKKYNVSKLVYFEEFDDKSTAVKREQQLKKWNRKWKIELIEKSNPNWNDLYETIVKKISPIEIMEALFGEPKQ